MFVRGEDAKAGGVRSSRYRLDSNISERRFHMTATLLNVRARPRDDDGAGLGPAGVTGALPL